MQAQVLIDRFLRSDISNELQLTAYERLILFFLASYMGRKKSCFPSIKALSMNCSFSTSTAIRTIGLLESKELISVTRSTGKSNHYSFKGQIMNLSNEIKTSCTETPVADSNSYQLHTGTPPVSESNTNNINNNINESTSNTREFKTPHVVNNSNLKDKDKEITEIFMYWQNVTNHPKAKLDKKRRNKIKDALKLGYEVDDLRKAIDGCANTPFNMGQNDRNQKYDDLGLILRDADHIDRFMANADQKKTNLSADNLMAGVI